MALVEQFDPLPTDLADLIQRDDTGEVLSWIRQRLNASQRDLDDLRFGNPRLLAQLRDTLEQHVEGSELDRYREEWERRAQVCYTWVRRLLAAHAINRESSGSVDTVDLEQLERALGKRLDALGPAPHAELLGVLMLPDFERPDRIGEFYGPQAADVRRAADRLRGGSDAPGGARRDAAGSRPLTRRTWRQADANSHRL